MGLLHISMHFLVPLVVAFVFFKPSWKYAYLVMLMALIIDLDHLLADPIYDPNRCSIGFHPLHTFYAIIVYIGFCLFPYTRLFGIGLAIHIVLDSLDCKYSLNVFFV